MRLFLFIFMLFQVSSVYAHPICCVASIKRIIDRDTNTVNGSSVPSDSSCKDHCGNGEKCYSLNVDGSYKFYASSEIILMPEGSIEKKHCNNNKKVQICCIGGVPNPREIYLWHVEGQDTTRFRCGNDNPGVDICKQSGEKCYYNGKEYNKEEYIEITDNTPTETICPTDNGGECSGYYKEDNPYKLWVGLSVPVDKDIFIDVKEKWKTGATIGGVSGGILALLFNKKPSCYIGDTELAKWKDSFSLDFPKIALNTNFCYATAFSQTISQCNGEKCETSIQTATNPTCNGLDTQARNDALQRYNKCVSQGGKFNKAKNDCEFEIVLKKKKDGKVLDTATVKAGSHKCHKELFEEYDKKRKRNAVLRTVGGVVIGGTAGGIAENQITQLWRFLKKNCGFTDKTVTKALANRIKNKEHKTVCELIKDIKKSKPTTFPDAEACMKQIDTKYRGK